MYKTVRSIARLRCIPFCSQPRQIKLTKISVQSTSRIIHTSVFLLKEGESNKKQHLPAIGLFNVENKNKETFNQALEMFIDKSPRRRGHVEFIYAALKYMEEFGVDYDLESYKNLIRVMPADVFVPQNFFQSIFMHYPKQQLCIVDVLDTMERKGIMPDTELGDILIDRFGYLGIPFCKYSRMMYWMPRFKNANPWPVPRPTPKDAYTLAKLAIERITSVDKQSVVSVLQTKDVVDAVDDTWIVSGQSPTQQRLLTNLPENATVQVEGPSLIWLRNLNVQYFILRTDPHDEPEKLEEEDVDDIRNLTAPWQFGKENTALKPFRSVHEQNDGIILGVCATGTSSRDSLLSWVRLLERHGNARLASIPVLFKLRAPPSTADVVVV